MNFTLEQARTLVTVAQCGSFAKAAKQLNKSHTALVYALKSMEDSMGVSLLNRTGYRTQLTDLGVRALERCEVLLNAANDLEELCRETAEGWEQRLVVVVDGIIPIEILLQSLESLRRANRNIRLTLSSDFLAGVEARFNEQNATMMASVIEPAAADVVSFDMPVIKAFLVVNKTHPLARQKALTVDDLEQHTFLTVRGSDPRLQMSTTALERLSTFHLSDFHAKKSAVLNGYGYGWMPEYLIQPELAKKTVVPIAWRGGEHVFRPKLHVRRSALIGRGVQIILKHLGMKA